MPLQALSIKMSLWTFMSAGVEGGVFSSVLGHCLREWSEFFFAPPPLGKEVSTDLESEVSLSGLVCEEVQKKW